MLKTSKASFCEAKTHVASFCEAKTHVASFCEAKTHVASFCEAKTHVASFCEAKTHVASFCEAKTHVASFCEAKTHVASFCEAKTHVVSFCEAKTHVVSFCEAKSKLLNTLMLAALAVSCAAMAADAETTSEKPGAAPGGLPFDHAGHIDIGYTNLTGSGRFINNINNRVFDFDRNAVNLHALDLTLSKLPENGFGGLVNFTAGKDADTIAAYGTIDKSRGPANGVNKKFDVTQAYLQYASGPFTIIGGKYVTLAGAEVIKSPSDVNYSRSILFGYAIPFTHTGVRGTYKLSDTFSLTAGVNNGWDDFQDTNSDKTIELGLSWAPIKSFALAAQGYTGKEQLSNYAFAPAAAGVSTLKGTRNLVDLVATYNATDQLTLVLNYDYGSQGDATLVNGTTGTAKWEGWAGYANYQINEKWRGSLRGEWFNDQDAYRTGAVEPGKTAGQQWKEATLTLAYLPTKATEIRAEVRNDWSDQQVFLNTDAVTPKSSQRSFGLEFLYHF